MVLQIGNILENAINTDIAFDESYCAIDSVCLIESVISNRDSDGILTESVKTVLANAKTAIINFMKSISAMLEKAIVNIKDKVAGDSESIMKKYGEKFRIAVKSGKTFEYDAYDAVTDFNLGTKPIEMCHSQVKLAFNVFKNIRAKSSEKSFKDNVMHVLQSCDMKELIGIGENENETEFINSKLFEKGNHKINTRYVESGVRDVNEDAAEVEESKKRIEAICTDLEKEIDSVESLIGSNPELKGEITSAVTQILSAFRNSVTKYAKVQMDIIMARYRACRKAYIYVAMHASDAINEATEFEAAMIESDYAVESMFY